MGDLRYGKDVGHLLHIYTNLISIPEERINVNLG